MSKLDLARIAKNIKTFTVKHSPEILTGIGIAGMLTTTVLAVKATPKALMLLEDAEDEKGDILTVPEKVKAAWKPYIPAAVTGVSSIVCMIGASSVSTRRTAALAAAYQISETALSEYREKVIETIGEKKEQVVREKVAEKKIQENPVSQREIIITEKGGTLCYEPLSDRYFKSDIEFLRKAENSLNKRIIHDVGGSVSLNEFYDELNLHRTDLGNDLGWNSDRLIELDLTSHISDDGTPAIVVGHYNPPKYDY